MFDNIENNEVVIANAVGMETGTVVADYVTEEAYILYPLDGEAAFCKVEMDQTVGEGKDVKSAFLNNGHKVYLPISNIAQGAYLSPSLRLRFGGTTLVGGVNADDGRAEQLYDLTGRKVEKLSLPGIYIVNGKKMIRR